MSSGDDETRPTWLATLPEWSLAVAALIYATGFLADFTYFGGFGVTEVGGDFFKAKYVHIGILCLLCHVILTGPACSFGIVRSSRGPRRQNGSMNSSDLLKTTSGAENEHQGHLPSLLLVINMLATFYAYAMFAPRSYLQSRQHLISSIFLATVLGFMLVRLVDSKSFHVTIESASQQLKLTLDTRLIAQSLRWILCVFVIYFLDRYSFKGLGPDLAAMFFGPKNKIAGGWVFFVLVGVILLIFWSTNASAKRTEIRSKKLAMWALGLCLIGATYYLSVLTFAFNVYPFIPAERGGGSFTETPLATLRFKGDASGALPLGLLDCRSAKCDCTKPLVVIEETNYSIFVADPDDAGGPFAWRVGARPAITSVNRDQIASVSYHAR